MADQPRRSRLDHGMDRVVALGRRLAAYGRDLVHNPLRILYIGIGLVLVVVALPLLIGGGSRLNEAWTDWRHERSMGRDWILGTGHLTELQASNGLTVRLYYFDRSGERHRAETHVEGTGAKWIRDQFPIRYDPAHPSAVDLVNINEANAPGRALVAAASIAAGFAALILAFAIWRRRRALAEAEHPLTVLRVPLAISGFVLALGIAAWAVGTVKLRGWSGVADRLGHHVSVAFGDMLGVTVPLVTFAIGCLLTAWLARHRHHEAHDGMLSSVHRIIDWAAGYVPSPDELKAEAPPAPAAEEAEPAEAVDQADDTDEVIRTGR